MSNIIKCVLFIIFICLCLSACKNDSTESNKIQTSSYTPILPEQLWSDYTASSETNPPTIDSDAKHIALEIMEKCVIETSESRTIKFDLDIPEVPEFIAYNYDNPQGGEYSISDIMSVFFGEFANNFIVFGDSPGELYHNSTDTYDNSLALYKKETGELYLVNGNAAAMDFTSTNMLKNSDDMEINLAEEEAVALCDKFLNDCGITGYKYDYTLYYGATQSTFYLIRYYYELDNLSTSSPISDGKGVCNLTFFVDNNGLAKVSGGLFDESSFNRGEEIDITQIISPNKAINCVIKQAASIRCGNETPEFDEFFSNHGEGLLYLPIREMKIGYWFSKYDGIKLAWIFYIGENEAIEKSASFAIDAISGKVYNY